MKELLGLAAWILITVVPLAWMMWRERGTK